MVEMKIAQTINPTGGNLSAIYEWGLTVIHFVQNAGSPALTLLARFFTLLGEPVAYIVLLPIILWCLDEKRGFKIGIVVFLSNGLNIALKEALRVPRPFTLDPSVKIIDETGFSTPSGHSQNSSAYYPLVADSIKRKGIRLAVSLAFPFCIGISRIYLGVHYPTDVFLGWAIGVLISIIVLFVLPSAKITKPLETIKKSIASAYAPSTAPADAQERSLRTLKLAALAMTALILNATNGRDSSMGGALFGYGAGYVFFTEKSRFSAASGSFLKKGIRLILGMTVLGALYGGLKIVFPGEESEYYTLFRFIRYGLMGFWATWAAPTLFIKCGLQ